MSNYFLQKYRTIKLMWKGFEEAEGWQHISTVYSSSNTEVHLFKMYQYQSSIKQSKVYAFKIITLSPPTSIVSSKSISHFSLKNKDVNKVKTEIIALQKLRGYSSITELYEVMTDDSGISDFFAGYLKNTWKGSKNVCLVMQYCPNRTLKDYLECRIMNQRQIIEFSIQIFQCLSALHQGEILHRDLRSINLMISECGRLKLIDFDCAFIRSSSTLDNLTYSFVEEVTAPEVISLINASQTNKNQLSPQDMYQIQSKCDLYSFGVLIYQMITKQWPQNQEERARILSHAHVSSELKEFVCLLLKNQNQRLNYAQSERFITFLAQKFNINYAPQQQRKLTKQSILLPHLQKDPSSSSQSISNSVSLSDWSLDSRKDAAVPSTSKQIERTTTISTYLCQHKTINE